ncbi:MAG: 23S rRNA (guanosine(2251)-2'-O)-methyltransferase RlmB [Myxococcales bacterium]|nr:23S rRNA (guanosine(2251)-2'-O)-methyltransferase RlmB [Myxococcales bacterium]
MSSRLVVGLQPVREAIRVHADKLRVLVEGGPSPQLEALARFAKDRGAEVERVTRGDLDRASKGGRHQGAIAYAPELRLVTLDELAAPSDTGPAAIVALDEIEDPQNFGAVVRSCVAIGASGVLWPEHRSAPLSPAMFRASAGAVEHAALCRVGALPAALEVLRARPMRVLGLDADGPAVISDEDLTGDVVLVVGAEGKGLRKPVKKACDALVRLPMRGPIASLNASVAAGIALYEIVRQRAASEAP